MQTNIGDEVLSEQLGQELAFYISELSLDQESKEQLINLLPYLSDKTLNQLIAGLKNQLTFEDTSSVEEEFKATLQEIADQELSTNQALKELLNKIKS